MSQSPGTGASKTKSSSRDANSHERGTDVEAVEGDHDSNFDLYTLPWLEQVRESPTGESVPELIEVSDEPVRARGGVAKSKSMQDTSKFAQPIDTPMQPTSTAKKLPIRALKSSIRTTKSEGYPSNRRHNVRNSLSNYQQPTCKPPLEPLSIQEDEEETPELLNSQTDPRDNKTNNSDKPLKTKSPSRIPLHNKTEISNILKLQGTGQGLSIFEQMMTQAKGGSILKAEIQRFRDEIERIQKDNRQLRDELELMEDLDRDRVEMCLEVEERIDGLEKRYEEEQRRCSELQARCAEWEGKCRELGRKGNEMERRNGRLQMVCEDLEEKCRDLDEKRYGLSKKCRDLKVGYEKLERIHEESKEDAQEIIRTLKGTHLVEWETKLNEGLVHRVKVLEQQLSRAEKAAEEQAVNTEQQKVIAENITSEHELDTQKLQKEITTLKQEIEGGLENQLKNRSLDEQSKIWDDFQQMQIKILTEAVIEETGTEPTSPVWKSWRDLYREKSERYTKLKSGLEERLGEQKEGERLLEQLDVILDENNSIKSVYEQSKARIEELEEDVKATRLRCDDYKITIDALKHEGAEHKVEVTVSEKPMTEHLDRELMEARRANESLRAKLKEAIEEYRRVVDFMNSEQKWFYFHDEMPPSPSDSTCSLPREPWETDEDVLEREADVERLRQFQWQVRRDQEAWETILDKAREKMMGPYHPLLQPGYARLAEQNAFERWKGEEFLRKYASDEDRKTAIRLLALYGTRTVCTFDEGEDKHEHDDEDF